MIKNLLFLLVFMVISSNNYARQRKIIDVHFHSRSAGDYGNSAPPNPVTGKVPKANSNQEICSENLRMLKKYNIVKAISSGTILRNGDYMLLDRSRFISSLEYPDHQGNSLPDTTTFKELYENKKFSVFGELGLQYEGRILNEPEFEPFLNICERLDIPVAIHTGVAAPNTPYTCCPKFRIEAGRPSTLEPVLIKHPKLRIQLMHMGYPFLEETKAIMNVYPQVSADLSAIDWLVPVQEFHDYLKSLIRAGLEDRLMYGSDQMIWEDAIPLSIKNIEGANFLTRSQKEKIFYSNAAKFYKIK